MRNKIETKSIPFYPLFIAYISAFRFYVLLKTDLIFSCLHDLQGIFKG